MYAFVADRPHAEVAAAVAVEGPSEEEGISSWISAGRCCVFRSRVSGVEIKLVVRGSGQVQVVI